MEPGDGELTPNREKPYVAGGGGDGDGRDGEDRLNALPNDILVHILLRVGTGGAARTSVLSRRWRHLWYLLPELDFGPEADAHSIRAALAAHESPSLRRLLVRAADVGPRRIAEWLPVAARRLAGDLFLVNSMKDSELIEQGTFLELPCFGSATSLSLELGFLGLAVPPSGVFARLTNLSICGVHFHGPCELGDAVSSPQFPSLKKLTVLSAHRMNNFNIHSNSLVEIVLHGIGLQQLNVVAPALELLDVNCHFSDGSVQSQPVANISAPKLEILRWSTTNLDQSSVNFGKMSYLKGLFIAYFYVYGEEDRNHDCLRLLQHVQFDAIPRLSILLTYFPTINGDIYLMEDMTVLPDIVFLNLIFSSSGHCIGPSLFHVLRMTTGVRRLKLELHNHYKREFCGSDCVCDLPPNWTSEELVLNSLREVQITNLRGTENEFAVVERLFSWAAVLKQMTINFHNSITVSTARELCEMLLSFSRPEISMKFYINQGSRKVLYVPED
uniref:F-box domain-containing protein n=1 Tax=Oryza glumipatula TaxID=40148 RepID=A0A0E0AJX2_9ORYZ